MYINKRMLRLLILFLILQCAAAASEDTEGNPSGDFDDTEKDETDEVISIHIPDLEGSPGTDESKGEENKASGDGTFIIIIAATSVVALAIVAIVAIVFFRRYLRNREQGVYSVPTEQVQKVVV